MATEQQADQQEGTPQDLAVTSGKEPVAPKGMTDKEAQEMRARAAQIVERLKDATGSKEMEIVDGITAVGIQAQRHAGTELELLRARVGEMITKDGPGAKISNDLVDLRVTLNQIDPHQAGQENFLRRIIYLVPFARDPLLRVLEKIAVRYEPVSQQVVIIETRLREGRMMLSRDNIELRKLYEQVESQQVVIQKNAYLGELVMQQLDQVIEGTDEPRKRDRIQNALYDVAMRTQDLRTMDEVDIQLFISLEMTRQNNTRLGQAVDRTLTLATNVVMVGLAIQSALVRQRRVLEATRRTREFIGNLLVANAASIKQHTTEIGDIYNSPVVAIDKISKAHNDLIEAIDIADRLKTEGIDAARQNIARLAQLSAELQERAAGLQEQREAKSLEA